jgi:hypothetical protein
VHRESVVARSLAWQVVAILVRQGLDACGRFAPLGKRRTRRTASTLWLRPGAREGTAESGVTGEEWLL